MAATRKKPFSLSKKYLSEKVASVIRERIYALEFSPGERLIVDTLAQEMDVSMTPIREGLKELVSQGLVTYDGKSYSIMRPTAEEILNLNDIRAYLEQLSARRAAEFMTKETVDKLLSEHKEYERIEHFDDWKQLIHMDQQFHRAITETANNARLQTMLETIQDQCWLIRHWIFAESYTHKTAKDTIEEHIEILEAIKDRDSEKAEQLMREHMKRSEEREKGHLDFNSFDPK